MYAFKKLRTSSVSMALFLVATLGSCQRQLSKEDVRVEVEQETWSSIELNKVRNSSGCLDISLLKTVMGGLRAETPAFVASTKFGISQLEARDAFVLLTAYGAFRFGSASAADLRVFDDFSQVDCEKIVQRISNSESLEYAVTFSAPDRVIAREGDGGKIDVQWRTPKEVMVQRRYEVYDAPCTEQSAYVELTLVYRWGEVVPSQLDPASERLAPDPDYLQLVARALGIDVETFYEVNSSTKVLVTKKLLELSSIRPRSELLACDTFDLQIGALDIPKYGKRLQLQNVPMRTWNIH